MAPQLVGGELIDAGPGEDGGRRDLRCGHRLRAWRGVDHLDRLDDLELGRGRRWLGRLRRRGVHHLRTRIFDLLLLLARSGLVLLGSGGAPPRGAMTSRLFRQRAVFRGLEPAFAVAIVTIDPVLAGGCLLAGLRQAIVLGGSGRRSRLLGSGIAE
jgi:hypothetical protein